MHEKYNFLFRTFGNHSAQFLGLIFGAIACIFLSIYKIPTHFDWMPREVYGILNFIFGTKLEIQSPGILGAILAITLYIFLCRRHLIDFTYNLMSILRLIVTIWGFGLVFNIVFGDLHNVLDGGITVTLAVFTYAVAVMGMQQYVPFACMGLCVLCISKILAAESALMLSGAFGVICMFLSLILQYTGVVDAMFGRNSNRDIDGTKVYGENRNMNRYQIPHTMSHSKMSDVGMNSVSLTGLRGFYCGRQLALSASATTLGRDTSRCQIMFPINSQTISRVHCVISYANGGYVIQDLSNNGTWLNGQRLPKGSHIPLYNGSEISLANGAEAFRFNC